MPASDLRLFFWLLSFSCWLFIPKAQANPIAADSTLPISSAAVCNGNSCTINGGTAIGGNLFHSFTEFSVPVGGEAYFNNSAIIQNIMARVTGTLVSNIDGLIKANYSAHLFLLNPQGIIFGENASLQLGGSFIASTAQAIKFADGTFFSATNPQIPSILTVSVPVGLLFDSAPNNILVQGQGNNDSIDPNIGLQVLGNQTIALLGGEVNINGGIIKTAGGRIELGSVAANSFVSLTPVTKGWALGYRGVTAFKDINLSGAAAVDASGSGGGDVQLWGKQIILKNGSQIEASNLDTENGGNLTLNATDSVQLMGVADNEYKSGLVTQVYPGATGNGGNLTISTKLLFLDNAALINTGTYSSGKAGDLTINTAQLIVKNGAQIGTGSFGDGDAGNLTVNASDSVQLLGTGFNRRSGLFTITTGNGAAGDLTINTNHLMINDGARASTSTRRAGKGGVLTVNATDSVNLTGISPDGLNPSGLFALSGEFGFQTTPADASGAGGSLILNTGQLSINNHAQLSVSAGGTGEAGNLDVTAKSIQLDNQSSIKADTKVGMGGNIQLVSGDLLLRHNSPITTNAADIATGGNINIHTNTLVSLENSDITANAVKGKGGNIFITSQGLFHSLDSNITASSELGVNGVVQIQSLVFDVKNALIPLKSNFEDSQQIVAGSCISHHHNQEGSFTITGTGGLADTPYQFFDSRYGVIKLQQISESKAAVTINNTVTWKLGDPIVEAQGLLVTNDGHKLLATLLPSPIYTAKKLVCRLNKYSTN